MNDYISKDLKEYVSLAVKLGKDKSLQKNVRKKIEYNKKNYLLFNKNMFIQALEKKLLHCYELI